MLLTEREAKTKWCPMAREVRVVGNDIMGPFNIADISGQQHRHRCIGSECAMWRWNVRDRDKRRTDEDGTPIGYCGLAGMSAVRGGAS
jgi:hypothetical protein